MGIMRVSDFVAAVDAEQRQPVPRTDIDLSPIVKQFGTWAITEYGLECVTTYYPIEKERLGEADWTDHMAGKDWVILKDFVRALRAAKRHFKTGI